MASLAVVDIQASQWRLRSCWIPASAAVWHLSCAPSIPFRLPLNDWEVMKAYKLTLGGGRGGAGLGEISISLDLPSESANE